MQKFITELFMNWIEKNPEYRHYDYASLNNTMQLIREQLIDYTYLNDEELGYEIISELVYTHFTNLKRIK